MKPDHKPEPEGYNWYTVRRGGRWHDLCKHCDRVVVWTNRGHWAHVDARSR